MVYEVERRAKVSEQEFMRCRRFLEKHGGFLGKMHMKSFLFREPHYLRIRMIKGEPNIIVTHKSGNYSSLARKETEKEFAKSELPHFLKQINKEGFVKCAVITTERHSYKLNGLKVELNIIEYFGRIVEVEALTEDEKKVSLLTKKILKTLKS